MKKELCKCKNIATWIYMPGSDNRETPYYCDNCVPRGCSCDHHYLVEEYDDSPPNNNENVDWKWIEKDKIWCHIDEKGREFPCIEYDYDENGFEKDE